MSAIAALDVGDDVAEQVAREVHQPQDERDDGLDDDADELDEPRERLAERGRAIRSNAPIGSSRSSSDSVSQTPRKVPVTSSPARCRASAIARLDPRRGLGDRRPTRRAARRSPRRPGISVMKPRIRFSAVRGTRSPVNGLLSEDHRQQVEAGDPVRVLAEPAEQRVLDQLEDLGDHRRGEVGDAADEPERARSASAASVSRISGRFAGWIAAHASLRTASRARRSGR